MFAPEGKQLYLRYCAGCHEVGTADAPLRSDSAFWEKRLAVVGSSSALTHTVITGSAGMPAKGTCRDCTDDQLRHAVEYMLLGNDAQQIVENINYDHVLEKIQLPPGFAISVYADGVPGARQMALADDGWVFVGSRKQGNVYELLPNKEGTAAVKVVMLLSDLNYPNGVAFKDNSLYVADIHRVLRFLDPTAAAMNVSDLAVINHSFPSRRWHGYKYLKFSPDGWLYTAVGMPCNSCNYRERKPIFGTIVRMRDDGSDLQTYAIGVRNSVGFDWHPQSGELWFTDNGQDKMGDDIPPDEINRAPREGMDFGFPYVYGDNRPSPGYEDKSIPKNLTPPAYNLPAHVAPLGMTFYRGTAFPKRFHQQLFVTEHGSWNRSSKIGYQLLVANLDANGIRSVGVFASGWLQSDEEVLGRPVDVINMPDGALLLSDDLNGLIYRLSYEGEKSVAGLE